MKKLLALLLAIILIFALSACGKSEISSNAETNTTDGNSNTIDQIVQEVMNVIKTPKEFVVGEELKNLNNEQISLPLREGKANIQEAAITKSKVLDINKTEDFSYEFGGYEFYKYQYTIKISGNMDSKYSGKYIRLKFHFSEGTMKIRTFFKGNVGNDIGSYGYDSAADLTNVTGCVFKVESDGSFKGEITALSNTNINEYMITGIEFTY